MFSRVTPDGSSTLSLDKDPEFVSFIERAAGVRFDVWQKNGVDFLVERIGDVSVGDDEGSEEDPSVGRIPTSNKFFVPDADWASNFYREIGNVAADVDRAVPLAGGNLKRVVVTVPLRDGIRGWYDETIPGTVHLAADVVGELGATVGDVFGVSVHEIAHLMTVVHAADENFKMAGKDLPPDLAEYRDLYRTAKSAVDDAEDRNDVVYPSPFVSRYARTKWFEDLAETFRVLVTTRDGAVGKLNEAGAVGRLVGFAGLTDEQVAEKGQLYHALRADIFKPQVRPLMRGVARRIELVEKITNAKLTNERMRKVFDALRSDEDDALNEALDEALTQIAGDLCRDENGLFVNCGSGEELPPAKIEQEFFYSQSAEGKRAWDALTATLTATEPGPARDAALAAFTVGRDAYDESQRALRYETLSAAYRREPDRLARSLIAKGFVFDRVTTIGHVTGSVDSKDLPKYETAVWKSPGGVEFAVPFFVAVESEGYDRYRPEWKSAAVPKADSVAPVAEDGAFRESQYARRVEDVADAVDAMREFSQGRLTRVVLHPSPVGLKTLYHGFEQQAAAYVVPSVSEDSGTGRTEGTAVFYGAFFDNKGIRAHEIAHLLTIYGSRSKSADRDHRVFVGDSYEDGPVFGSAYARPNGVYWELFNTAAAEKFGVGRKTGDGEIKYGSLTEYGSTNFEEDMAETIRLAAVPHERSWDAEARKLDDEFERSGFANFFATALDRKLWDLTRPTDPGGEPRKIPGHLWARVALLRAYFGPSLEKYTDTVGFTFGFPLLEKYAAADLLEPVSLKYGVPFRTDGREPNEPMGYAQFMRYVRRPYGEIRDEYRAHEERRIAAEDARREAGGLTESVTRIEGDLCRAEDGRFSKCGIVLERLRDGLHDRGFKAVFVRDGAVLNVERGGVSFALMPTYVFKLDRDRGSETYGQQTKRYLPGVLDLETVGYSSTDGLRKGGEAGPAYAALVAALRDMGVHTITAQATGNDQGATPVRNPSGRIVNGWAGYYALPRWGFDADVGAGSTNYEAVHATAAADEYVKRFGAPYPASLRLAQIMADPEKRRWWREYGYTVRVEHRIGGIVNEAIEQIAGDLCRAEDGRFASCDGVPAPEGGVVEIPPVKPAPTPRVVSYEDAPAFSAKGSFPGVRFYHATVALDAVAREGLKSKRELEADGKPSEALGGGSRDTVSLTPFPGFAENVARTVRDAIDIANSGDPGATMYERLRAFGMGDDELRSPEAVDRALGRAGYGSATRHEDGPERAAELAEAAPRTQWAIDRLLDGEKPLTSGSADTYARLAAAGMADAKGQVDMLVWESPAGALFADPLMTVPLPSSFRRNPFDAPNGYVDPRSGARVVRLNNVWGPSGEELSAHDAALRLYDGFRSAFEMSRSKDFWRDREYPHWKFEDGRRVTYRDNERPWKGDPDEPKARVFDFSPAVNDYYRDVYNPMLWASDAATFRRMDRNQVGVVSVVSDAKRAERDSAPEEIVFKSENVRVLRGSEDYATHFLAEAVETIVGDLCRAEDGQFASCAGDQGTLPGVEIDRYLKFPPPGEAGDVRGIESFASVTGFDQDETGTFVVDADRPSPPPVKIDGKSYPAETGTSDPYGYLERVHPDRLDVVKAESPLSLRFVESHPYAVDSHIARAAAVGLKQGSNGPATGVSPLIWDDTVYEPLLGRVGTRNELNFAAPDRVKGAVVRNYEDKFDFHEVKFSAAATTDEVLDHVAEKLAALGVEGDDAMDRARTIVGRMDTTTANGDADVSRSVLLAVPKAPLSDEDFARLKQERGPALRSDLTGAIEAGKGDPRYKRYLAAADAAQVKYEASGKATMDVVAVAKAVGALKGSHVSLDEVDYLDWHRIEPDSEFDRLTDKGEEINDAIGEIGTLNAYVVTAFIPVVEARQTKLADTEYGVLRRSLFVAPDPETGKPGGMVPLQAGYYKKEFGSKPRLLSGLPEYVLADVPDRGAKVQALKDALADSDAMSDYGAFELFGGATDDSGLTFSQRERIEALGEHLTADGEIEDGYTTEFDSDSAVEHLDNWLANVTRHDSFSGEDVVSEMQRFSSTSDVESASDVSDFINYANEAIDRLRERDEEDSDSEEWEVDGGMRVGINGVKHGVANADLLKEIAAAGYGTEKKAVDAARFREKYAPRTEDGVYDGRDVFVNADLADLRFEGGGLRAAGVDVVKMFGLPPGSGLKLSSNGSFEAAHPELGLTVNGSIKENAVEIGFMGIAKENSMHGLSSYVVASAAKHAAAAGLDYITAIAGANGMDGWKVWPRLGFDAPWSELSGATKAAIEEELPALARQPLSKIIEDPKGWSIFRRTGAHTAMDVRMDLTDEKAVKKASDFAARLADRLRRHAKKAAQVPAPAVVEAAAASRTVGALEDFPPGFVEFLEEEERGYGIRKLASLAEAVENVVGDLCRAEDGKFASCGNAKPGFDPLKIVKIVRVSDTREVYEDENGRTKRLPGSGLERECDRCGRAHEVHVFVATADNDEYCVGASCARGTSIEREVAARVRSATDVRGKERAVEKAEKKVAESQEAVATIERLKAEVGVHMPPVKFLGYRLSRAGSYKDPVYGTLAEAQAAAVEAVKSDKGIFAPIGARAVYGIKTYPGAERRSTEGAPRDDALSRPFADGQYNYVESDNNYARLTREVGYKDGDRDDPALPLTGVDPVPSPYHLGDRMRRQVEYNWLEDAAESLARSRGTDYAELRRKAEYLPFEREAVVKAKVALTKTRMKAEGADDDAIAAAARDLKRRLESVLAAG